MAKQEYSAHAVISSLIRGGQRVLDLGCGPGDLARLLVAKGCQVTGVDSDPALAEQASSVCQEVAVGRLEHLERLDLPSGHFDVILFADVLEHLIEPEQVLKSALGYLAPEGRVVISVPNAANFWMRLSLLRGKFEYQQSGLLDRGHLRFFTWGTLSAMLARCGLRVLRLDPTPSLGLYLLRSRVETLPSVLGKLDRLLTRSWPTLLAQQFIVVAEMRQPRA